MRTRIERLWPLLALALVVAMVLFSFPYLASAYYLEAGGRALDRPQEALKLFHRAIAWDSGNAQAFRWLAAAYERQSNGSAAEGAIRRYIELRPRNPLGHIELAEMYEAMAAEARAENRVHLEAQALEEWQRTGVTVQDAIVIGRTLVSTGEFEDAGAWFRRAIALQPEIGDAWYELGVLFQEREQWSEALHAFEQAIHVGHFESISLADCHYRRGLVLAAQGHDIEDYIRALELAVSADPQHARARARLGSAYYERDGDPAAAEAELKQAIALAPNDKWIYLMLGDVYRLEGRKEQARAMYAQALGIDPAFSGALTRLQAIDNEP